MDIKVKIVKNHGVLVSELAKQYDCGDFTIHSIVKAKICSMCSKLCKAIEHKMKTP